MNILITGANGFLGQHLTLYLAALKHKITACSRGECRIFQQHLFQYYPVDLTDEHAVAVMIAAIKPEIIIHSAAMSKPDECQTNKDACLQHNVQATKFLIESLQAISTVKPHFIYISTDFIFGENGPHSEDDTPGPINFYGESKLMAEHLVQQSGLKNTIVRPVFIYGPVLEGMRQTFLHWVKNNLEQNKKIKVVSDQQRTPTFVIDLCCGIETIVNQAKTGIYHLAGKNILSPYEMALKTASALGLNSDLIEDVTADFFDEPVKRPKQSGLKIDKAKKELNYEPVSFDEGVRLTFTANI